MKDLVSVYLRTIKEMRDRHLTNEQFSKQLEYVDTKGNKTDSMYGIALYNLSKYPRTEIVSYSQDVWTKLNFSTTIPLDELTKLDSWTKTWIVHFEHEETSEEFLCQHFCFTNENEDVIHAFDELILKDDKPWSNFQYYFNEDRNDIFFDSDIYNPSIPIDRIKQLIIIKALMISNMFLLFHQKNDNIEIIRPKKRHNKKGSIVPKFSTIVEITVNLSGKGKRYIQGMKATTTPTRHRNIDDYIVIQKEIKSFIRHQKVGPGRTEIKEVHVRAFNRGVWISKKDKLVKVIQ